MRRFCLEMLQFSLGHMKASRRQEPELPDLAWNSQTSLPPRLPATHPTFPRAHTKGVGPKSSMGMAMIQANSSFQSRNDIFDREHYFRSAPHMKMGCFEANKGQKSSPELRPETLTWQNQECRC